MGVPQPFIGRFLVKETAITWRQEVPTVLGGFSRAEFLILCVRVWHTR